MPAFLQRLKHPFRRHSHHISQTILPVQRQDTGKQSAEDYYDEDEDGEEYAERPRRNSSPAPLPVIVDSGPPTTGRYKNEDIFWNSVMIEADSDPTKVAVRRQQQRRNTSYEPLNAREAGPWRDARDPSVRQETRDYTPKSSAPKTSIQKRDRELEGIMRRARSQGDNDFTVMAVHLPRHTPSPHRPPSPPKEPIKPGTEQWDAFMDFPSENSRHAYRDDDGNCHVVFPLRTHPMATTVPTTAKPTVKTEAGTPLVHELAFSPPPQPDNQQNVAPPDSPVGEVLTWNLILNRILDNQYVDPAMKQAVRERVQTSSTANGSGHGEVFFASAQAARLVPNFSYPIAGSPFYDRVAVERIRPRSPLTKIIEHSDEEHTKGEQKLLPNGVTPSNSSSTDSDESDHNTLHRAPTPHDESPDRIHPLLSTMLTYSELSLHNRILNHSPSKNTTSLPSPCTSPPRDTLASTSLHDRLILSLHTTILGLQDRVTHLEDTLVPQLSTWLEQKSHRIDELSVAILNSRAEIMDLKATVDFGNKLLGGCWKREWEVWRTLAQIRRIRTAASRRSLIPFLSGRGQRKVYRDLELLGNAMPQGYVGRTFGDGYLDTELFTPRSNGRKRRLSTSELDALILMAEQNVTILKEDVTEMVEMVRDCKRAGKEARKRERAVEGTWRDV